MKYLIVEIQKMVDGTIAHIVETADTQREAESKYHGKLQYAALSDLPCHAVALLDETGNCVAHEYYIKEEEPGPEPEPDPEPNEGVNPGQTES